MPDRFQERIDAELASRSAAALYRRRRVVEARAGVRLTVDGRELLSFCSNDYLGLADDPRLAEAMAESARRDGAGSGAAHLISGHQRVHHELEERLAAFTGRPRALLFSTGYMANLGIASALVGRGDRVLADRLNHASLLDAGLLSGARFARYAHADPEALRGRLARGEGPALVLTDGVFSMDGDLAPLPALADVTRAAGGWLSVDDAHGFGVLGNGGRGSLEHFGLDLDRVPVLMGTLGKALGCFGAFVAGSEALIEYLIQRARSYVYTTALPAPVAAAASRALEIVVAEPERRVRVLDLARRFRAGAAQLGYALMPSETPIQPVLIGEAAEAVALSKALEAAGLWVPAIRPPTVPTGSARLRVTLSAAHDAADLDRLLNVLAEHRPRDKA